jgi:hypothetical protein
MATAGTWLASNLGGMPYYVLLPANYSPTQHYPVLLYLHYGGQDPGIPASLDAWFNTPEFQADYPAIVVAPVIVGSNLNNNWGAYPVGNDDNENQALAILQTVMSEYSYDPGRVYVTGASLGGHGTWDLMIKDNAYTGTEGRIFAAGLPLAGGWEPTSYDQLPDAATVNELRSVPIWAVQGAMEDPTWDAAMAADLGPNSAFHFTSVPYLAEDVWDTTYPLPYGKPYYDWLFSQASSVPETIGGTSAGLSVTDETSLAPFAGVTITDPNNGQTDTVTVTLSAAANGDLANLGGGEFDAATGVYSVSGTAASVTAAVDGLVFNPTLFQAAVGQTVTTSFTITVTDTAGQSASDGTTNVTTLETQDPNYSAVVAAGQAIARVMPSPAAADQVALQITAGQTTLAQYDVGRIASDAILRSTLAALVTIDAVYDATPASQLLTTAAAASGGTVYYTAAELHDLGYADSNVWIILAAEWGPDPGSDFFARYGQMATGAPNDYANFLNAVYAREFGFAPAAANLNNLLADVPGVQALLSGNGHPASELQVMAGLYGYLLEVGQSNGIGQYYSAADAFLLAAANGTANYGEELTLQFPSGDAAAKAMSAATTPTDVNVITVTGSEQLIDPGAGNHAIQFMAGTVADTLVLHSGGLDQVSGFDLDTDVLDLRSLLTEAKIDLNGDAAVLAKYLTVTDLGSDALVNFDPANLSVGGTVAVLRGLGGTVTSVSSLLAHGALRIAE